jgi:beta-lactamase regulating signal transducer with metallopeptidase domain/uncharacterized coiled-coil DUF342 family protein
MADGSMVIGALGWALLDFLWQGLLVGALAAFVLHALRNARPQARYAVACIALAACLALPLASWLRGMDLFEGESVASLDAVAPHATTIALTRTIGALPATNADWRGALQAQMPAIVAAWSAGALLLALRLLLGCRWVGRLRSRARLPNSFWQGRFDELAVRVGLKAPVPLRLSETIDSPVAAGWWRPVVLVPAALIASMPVDLLAALLAHDLAHGRRRDYLVNLLQGAVETLLFYHPVVWWLSRRVRIEREQIADDLACNALGDPRQLALALQALDRFQQTRREEHEFLAHAHLLPAAHGGQLMPRIKRLLRPDHQRPDWKLALPIAGLAALGLAVHAAQAMTPAVPAVTPVAKVAAVPAVAAAPATAPVANVAVVATPSVSVTPAVAPVAAVAVTPRVAATPAVAPVVATVATSGIHTRASREPYAMVREGEDGMTLSGDLDDMNEVKIARQHVHGDFLWFRRNGVGYVVQDAALLGRARRAWEPAEEIGKKMEALSDQMKPHSARMEALGKQMEAYSAKGEPYSREMEALGKKMEPLARQQSELGEKMRKLSMTAADAQAHEADMQRLQVQMDGLSQKMEVLSRQMETQSAQMSKAHEPMEALGRQMQEASAPMEALGKQMEPLGKQIEVLSKKADAEVVQLIDQAVREGKAVPAKQLSR